MFLDQNFTTRLLYFNLLCLWLMSLDRYLLPMFLLNTLLPFPVEKMHHPHPCSCHGTITPPTLLWRPVWRDLCFSAIVHHLYLFYNHSAEWKDESVTNCSLYAEEHRRDHPGALGFFMQCLICRQVWLPVIPDLCFCIGFPTVCQRLLETMATDYERILTESELTDLEQQLLVFLNLPAFLWEQLCR